MSDFLGLGPTTWRVFLAIGCLGALMFAIGAVSEATEHDWAGMTYLAVMAVAIVHLVWRSRGLAHYSDVD